MSKRRLLGRVPPMVVSIVLLAGCQTGPSMATKKTLNALIVARNYTGAAAHLESVKEGQYGRKNQVLYYLDRGMVLHHEGKFKESDESFDKAELRIEELYTKSISQAGGMLLLNDATVEYAGEHFERALLNVFRALNYVFLGKPDEALVESRKVEQFLTELGAKLEKKAVYKDDAFARYLDALLYADQGKMDDSRISLDAARKAYSWYESDYHMPVPALEPPLVPSAQKGELVFIHYNGIAPRKISKTFQVAWGQALAIAQADDGSKTQRFSNALRAGIVGNAITVANPDYVQDPYSIVGSEVVVGSGVPSRTALMEDISAIARKNLMDRLTLIQARAIARAVVKFVIAEAASREAMKACEKMSNDWAVKACRFAIRGTSHGAAAATEVADTRSWSSLPAQIRMARLQLPAGRYDVRVDFKDAAGVTVSSHVFKDVAIDQAKRTYCAYRTAS